MLHSVLATIGLTLHWHTFLRWTHSVQLHTSFHLHGLSIEIDRLVQAKQHEGVWVVINNVWSAASDVTSRATPTRPTDTEVAIPWSAKGTLLAVDEEGFLFVHPLDQFRRIALLPAPSLYNTITVEALDET